VFDEVVLVSGRVRRCRLSVGAFFGKVGLMSVHVREVGLVSGPVLRGRVIVGMCSVTSAFCRECTAKSVKCRDVSGEVGIQSGHDRRCRLSVETCSTKSV